MSKFGDVIGRFNAKIASSSNPHPNLSKVKGELPYQGKDISKWVLLFGFLISVTGLPAIIFGLYFSESTIYHQKEKLKKYHKNARKYAEIISSLGLLALIIQIAYWLMH